MIYYTNIKYLDNSIYLSRYINKFYINNIHNILHKKDIIYLDTINNNQRFKQSLISRLMIYYVTYNNYNNYYYNQNNQTHNILREPQYIPISFITKIKTPFKLIKHYNNISHKKNIIIISMSYNDITTCDIESITQINKINKTKFIPKILSKNDTAILNSIFKKTPPYQHNIILTSIWSSKESIFKQLNKNNFIELAKLIKLKSITFNIKNNKELLYSYYNYNNKYFYVRAIKINNHLISEALEVKSI